MEKGNRNKNTINWLNINTPFAFRVNPHELQLPVVSWQCVTLIVLDITAFCLNNLTVLMSPMACPNNGPWTCVPMCLSSEISLQFQLQMMQFHALQLSGYVLGYAIYFGYILWIDMPLSPPLLCCVVLSCVVCVSVWLSGWVLLFTCQCQGRVSQLNSCKSVSLIVTSGAILIRFSLDSWNLGPLLTGRLGTSSPAFSFGEDCPFWVATGSVFASGSLGPEKLQKSLKLIKTLLKSNIVKLIINIMKLN